MIILLFLQIAKIIENAPTQKDFPNACAVILLDKKVIEVNKDLTTSFHRQLFIRVFNDRGRDKYETIKQRYNDLTQEVKLISTKTHTPDGKIVTPDENAICDMSAPEVMQAAAYTNIKMKAVTFPDLQKDAIIEYEYKVIPKKSRTKEKRYFFGEEMFVTEEPIIKKEFSIILPKEVKLKYKVVNGVIEPHTVEKEQKIEYTWRMDNISPIELDPYSPPIHQIGTRLVFSSFNDWTEVAEWLSKQFYKSDKLDRKHKIKELIKNNLKDETIKDCYLYVTTGIRNVPLKLGEIEFTPTPSHKVLKNKYGDGKDKSILLYSLLKEANIPAYPVFVNTFGISIIRDVPSPAMFNHILLAVEKKEDYFLLDPMAVDCKFGYPPEEVQNTDAFILHGTKGKFITTVKISGEDNLSETEMKLTISEQGDLTGEIYTKLFNFFDHVARKALKDETKKELDVWFDAQLRRISTNAKIGSYSTTDLKDLTTPVEIGVKFSAENFVQFSSSMQFSIPCNPFDFASIIDYIGLEKRNYSMRIGSPRVIKHSVEIELPKNLIPEYLPQKLDQENEFAKISIDCKSQDSKISFKTELVMKKAMIELDEYPEFKTVVGKYLSPKNYIIILTQKQEER